ncbi:MAG: N-acetylneuraminate synthase family protein [Flavobacteriales bacterium]|nr:N-acetylneuraminate synthase family protein [Flavobacteriales bacterium]
MITNYQNPNVAAEICGNHMGSLEIAKQMIKVAAEGGITVAKFQKRNNKEFLTEEQYNAPHPNKMHSFGEPYGEHREFIEFSIQEHGELKEYAESLGIMYSSSTFDVTSAKEIITLNPEYIKVPSACNNHFAMLRILRDEYSGGVHISFGMTTKQQEEEIVQFFEKTNQAKRLVIYACTSGYPVPFKDVCLLEIVRLRETFSNRVDKIGFSGHHHGIAVDVAAYTLGAEWFERHFTLDRTWKGTDQVFSLEPTGMRKLARDLRATQTALTFKKEDILDIEKPKGGYEKYKSE